MYRVILSSGTCFSDTSSNIVVNVDTVSAIPVVTPAFTCGPGQVTLQASSNGNNYWYSSTNLNSLLHVGNTFSPNISTTTTYKVRSSFGLIISTGYLNNSIGTSNTQNSESKGIRIQVDSPCILENLSIYPLQTGVVHFKLYDSESHEYLNSTSQQVTAGIGIEKVSLGYYLTGFRTYDLIVDSISVPLEINTSGINYPIAASGSPITVLGYVDSIFHSTPDFYNFYDINITTGCVSNTTNVTGTVYPSFTNATAIPLSPLVFCQGDSVKFSTAPTGNFTYQWLKNGLPIGSTGNSYIAKTAGTYQVIMNNSSGCVDTSSAKNVRVPCIQTFDPVEKMESSFEFSNEAQINIHYLFGSGELVINTILTEDETYNLIILDQTGREVFRDSRNFSMGENSYSINEQNLSTGLYILKLESEKNRFVKRWMKN